LAGQTGLEEEGGVRRWDLQDLQGRAAGRGCRVASAHCKSRHRGREVPGEAKVNEIGRAKRKI
jgi:hypothetical protein